MQMHNVDHPQCATEQALQHAACSAAIAQENLPSAAAQTSECWVRDWVFRRNCAMSPQQLMMFFISLSVVSLVVAAIAWDVGGSFVMPFTAIELGSVAIALLVYARHATDRECVRLSPQCLQVEWENAGVVQSVSFNPHWVRISLPDSGLIALSSAGKTVYVGRFTRPERRVLLAKDLRAALRAL